MKIFNTRILLFVFGAALLGTACKSPHKVQYGYQGCYWLEDGERNLQISQDDMDFYAKYCFTELHKGQLAMMVNRALKGKTRAYISLAILLTPDEFETINRKDPDIDVLDEKEFGTKYTLFKSLLVKRSGMYICRTFFTEYKHNELVVYDIVDADETKVRAYFDNESLLRSKLNCGKDR